MVNPGEQCHIIRLCMKLAKVSLICSPVELWRQRAPKSACDSLGAILGEQEARLLVEHSLADRSLYLRGLLFARRWSDLTGP